MSVDFTDRERKLRTSFERSGVFLYQQTRGRLVDLARRHGADEGVAADVVHDAFATLFEKRPDVRCIEAWLAQVVRCRCADRMRRRRSHDRWMGRQAIDEQTDRSEDPILLRRLQESLETLPRKMKALLLRRFVEGHDEPTAARLAGYSPSSYKRIATRALSRLRAALSASEPSTTEVGTTAP